MLFLLEGVLQAFKVIEYKLLKDREDSYLYL